MLRAYHAAGRRQSGKVVTPYNTKSSHNEHLGRVSFGQYKRAPRCVGHSGVVCVCELGDTAEGKQVALSERVRFGNDGDEVDACTTKALCDLNVEWLETKTGSDET